VPDITIVAGTGATAVQANTYMTHTGGAWNTWTPVVTQSNAVTVTIGTAAWFRAGRFIAFHAELTVASTGTAANDIVISLPVAGVGTGLTALYGQGSVFDLSAPNQRWIGALVPSSTTTVKIQNPFVTTLGYLGGSGFSAAVASGDVIAIAGHYEATTG
jgi:hypothetical protein